MTIIEYSNPSYHNQIVRITVKYEDEIDNNSCKDYISEDIISASEIYS